MNFILSIIGAAILVVLGFVIGFWLDVALTPALPNGFYECQNCGPSFADTHRWWAGRKP
jgi:hypothetical protein